MKFVTFVLQYLLYLHKLSICSSRLLVGYYVHVNVAPVFMVWQCQSFEHKLR